MRMITRSHPCTHCRGTGLIIRKVPHPADLPLKKRRAPAALIRRLHLYIDLFLAKSPNKWLSKKFIVRAFAVNPWHNNLSYILFGQKNLNHVGRMLISTASIVVAEKHGWTLKTEQAFERKYRWFNSELKRDRS